MASEQGKIYAAKAAYIKAEKGDGHAVSEGKDSELQSKFHDRSYNPANEAQRGSIGAALNQDAARYKKGPGPL